MKYRNEILFLKEIGTETLYHKGGGKGNSLYHHLIGTAKLLLKYGRPEIEVVCGLFHSIYGTEYYPRAENLNITRNKIRSIVGYKAEKLIHQFCSLQMGRKELLSNDYFDEETLTSLRWVAYCNGVEQGDTDEHLVRSVGQLLGLNDTEARKESIDFTVLSLFPSPLGVVNLGENMRALNKQIIKDIDNEMLMSPVLTGQDNNIQKRTFANTEGTWQSLSSPGMETKYQSFDMLKDIIWQVASPVMINVGYKEEYIRKKLELRNLWANVIWKRGGWSEPHTHGTGETLFSGVYYPISPNSQSLNLDDFPFEKHIVNSSKTAPDGSLVIADPARSVKIIKGEVRGYPYYGQNIAVIPRESLLILFPAWLEHYVTPLIDEKFKRYSISFGIAKVRQTQEESLF